MHDRACHRAPAWQGGGGKNKTQLTAASRSVLFTDGKHNWCTVCFVKCNSANPSWINKHTANPDHIKAVGRKKAFNAGAEKQDRTCRTCYMVFKKPSAYKKHAGGKKCKTRKTWKKEYERAKKATGPVQGPSSAVAVANGRGRRAEAGGLAEGRVREAPRNKAAEEAALAHRACPPSLPALHVW